jgi:exportin-1
MQDLPEFRVNLFKLLHSINEFCFEAFLQYVSSKEDIINGILWAVKHTEQTVMHTGLELLNSFLGKVLMSPLGESFYSAFMKRIFTEVLVAALDRTHASGFDYHCKILMRLFYVSRCNMASPTVGVEVITEFLKSSLSVFRTLSAAQTERFIENCYVHCEMEKDFRDHFSDFMVETQVWGAEQENMLELSADNKQREDGLSAPPEASRVPADNLNDAIML